MKAGFAEICKRTLREVTQFCAEAGRIQLRSYQVQVAQAIVESVIHEKGLTFVVVFPRQSGKNELQAQIEAYLLVILSVEQAEIVKVSPTWKPQSLNAMRRLERVLTKNLMSRGRWKKRSGYIYQLGGASMYFLSGAPTSSIVGATASTLLECDEAQDVSTSKWDKEIAPMGASTNATRVFWGTAWTSQTLLARELCAAKRAEQDDGIRRCWVLNAQEVGVEVPAYRKFVDEQVSRLGRNNPLVRTQYFSEEIDGEGGMFPLTRRLLMIGSHPPRNEPVPGEAYAFTIDIAGQDESAASDLESLSNPGRDSTVLTIFKIEAANGPMDLNKKPTYWVVQRIAWQGTRHSSLYGTFLSLDEIWSPQKVIIDSTGVGAGIANFLKDRLGGRCIPFEFNQRTKSDLGWDFLTIIESGRYKEFFPMDPEMIRQLDHCQYSILDGPGKVMRWGVPDGRRDAASGDLVHDDYIISAALVSLLDHETWGVAASHVIEPQDILDHLAY